MYAMKIEDLKGRGKVRTHSGLFSMGALAIALSACGGDFKLAEEKAVAVDGNKVTLTFTDTPKSVDGTKIKVSDVALVAADVTTSGKTVVIDLKTTGNAIKVTFDAGGLKGSDDKDYTTALTIDNKAPSATGATAAAKVVTVTFDEKITAADPTKFTIGSKAATTAVVDTADTTGKTVTVTFADDASGTLTLAAGAVTDDAASQSNTEGLLSGADTQAIGGGGSADTTPPVLASTTPVVVDKTAKTITVDFDETIATKVDASITVSYDADGTGTTSAKASLTLTTDYTIDVTGGDVVITLTKTDALTAGGVYSVAFAADAVTDSDGNKNALIADTAAPAVASLEDDLVGLSLGSSDADYGF